MGKKLFCQMPYEAMQQREG